MVEKRYTISPTKAANRDKTAKVSFNKVEWDRFEQLKEEYGFKSNAGAIRYFLNIGMRSIVDTDPRNNTKTADGQSTAPKIRDYVPEGRENAVDLKDELPEIIAAEMLDIVEADDQIKRDKFEVWK